MSNKRLKICVVSLFVAKAFVVPLSNLIQVLHSFSCQIQLIVGNIEDVTIKVSSPEIHIHKIYHKTTTNILFRVARYIYTQVRISLALVRTSRNVDVCIFFMEMGHLLPMLIAKVLRKKIVWMLPSSLIKMNEIHKYPLGVVSVHLHNISCALANKIILYSPNLIKEWNLQKYKNKICIAHRHFLDFDKFKIKKKIDERDNLIGYIGRLSKEKGILNFIKAIPEISKRKDAVRFLIGGDGQLKDKVEKYLEKENLNHKVKLAGWISHDELPDYMNELRLLVLPSYTEGLPNVMLESMACGTPVLATSVGAIPDVIKDGETGFIMENNSLECIAENVIRSLNHPNLEQVTRNACALVEKEFTYEKAVERYREILNDITQES